MTHDEVAAALSRALDRTITYTRPSLPRYRAHARRTGMSAGTTAVTSALDTLARVGVDARVGDDLGGIPGRAPRDIDEFARDHRAGRTRSGHRGQ